MSHWPRVTDIKVVLHLRGQGLEEGDEHLPTLSCEAWSTLPFTFTVIVSVITLTGL